jgi:hypothetical protein
MIGFVEAGTSSPNGQHTGSTAWGAYYCFDGNKYSFHVIIDSFYLISNIYVANAASAFIEKTVVGETIILKFGRDETVVRFHKKNGYLGAFLNI